MAQLAKHPIWAQVMISRLVSSSPTSGSVLTVQSLEPALDLVSSSLSLSKINIKKIFFEMEEWEQNAFSLSTYPVQGMVLYNKLI